MKEAYWGYWLLVLGIFIIVVLLLVQNFTSTNSQDFYLVKEIAEAAMEDALDYGYYRTFGEAKINKEKFYESFIRRFAEEASISTTYDIEFTEIYEAPPKIGVKVSSKSNTFSVFGDSESFDIVNRLDAIMESKVTQGSTTYWEEQGPEKKGNYKEYADVYMVSDGSESQFAGKTCKYNYFESQINMEVYKCGTFTEIGFELTSGVEKGKTYCLAYDKQDNTQYIVSEIDNFLDPIHEPYCN